MEPGRERLDLGRPAAAVHADALDEEYGRTLAHHFEGEPATAVIEGVCARQRKPGQASDASCDFILLEGRKQVVRRDRCDAGERTP